MRCPSCDKKVIFGSVVGEAWRRIHSGEWLLGGRPPHAGKLGDCPQCGARLEWEPGEEQLQDPSRPAPARVHLSALRENPSKFDGRDLWLRALVIERAGVVWLSDSWRVRQKSGESEPDGAMLDRLEREQSPRLEAVWQEPEARKLFRGAARKLDASGDPAAAWAEAEGRFQAAEGGGILSIAVVASVWPPKD